MAKVLLFRDLYFARLPNLAVKMNQILLQLPELIRINRLLAHQYAHAFLNRSGSLVFGALSRTPPWTLAALLRATLARGDQEAR